MNVSNADIRVVTAAVGEKDRVSSRALIEDALTRVPDEVVASYTWVLVRGLHWSRTDDRQHYTVHGFRPDGYARKRLHIYDFGESECYEHGGGRFRKEKTLDVDSACEELRYVLALDMSSFNGLTS
ncbi:hypothetical protein M413DRAFT_22041 [Hebeloma cylindrosporum]|uniref:Uncharacterized protein n=1 Tax=Hebeloma cylindrosporum TaxID=76867 RepID=A0A0C2Z9W9_HEBCY|nr:hypothetical protein M413DRAFT_22041 [Hebeloma cylindrosporum h7]